MADTSNNADKRDKNIMAAKPVISVVTATRNRIDLLHRALESIAAQNYRDYEALVLDDGSDESVQRQYDALWADLPENSHSIACHRPALPVRDRGRHGMKASTGPPR